jgi:hypothetical protein
MQGQIDQGTEFITEVLAGLLIDFVIRGDLLITDLFLDEDTVFRVKEESSMRQQS